jgi:hypothetical protein
LQKERDEEIRRLNLIIAQKESEMQTMNLRIDEMHIQTAQTTYVEDDEVEQSKF